MISCHSSPLNQKLHLDPNIKLNTNKFPETIFKKDNIRLTCLGVSVSDC